MSKITLNNLADLNNASTVIATINTNNSTIQTAMDNTLSRDGTSPNQMQANLDMNNFRIINLLPPATPSEPVRLQEFSQAIFGVIGSSANFSNIPAHALIIGTGSSVPNTVTMADTQLLIGQTGGSDPAAKTVSGDATLADTGVITVTKTSGTVFASSATVNTTNAGNITTGTLLSSVFPALIGDLTGSSGTFNVTVGKVNGVIYPSLPASSTVPVVTGASTVTYQKVTNTSLANMNAWTLKGNNSSSSASPGDFTVDALTLKASPIGSDEVLIWDVAGAAMKKAVIGSIASATTILGKPGGRLTLTSGTPVMTASVAGATTVYYTPYEHNSILIYNGTIFVPTAFSELSQATTDATKSPAAVVANSNYDVFVWNDSGTIRATRGPAWSTNTTRGTGVGTTQLQLLNGVHVNAVAITNGPAINQGTYVGTIHSNGSSTIDFVYGGFAAGGTTASFNVWNKYNRVLIGTNVGDNGPNYTYTSGVIRQAHASAGMQVTWLAGLAEDVPIAKYQCTVTTLSPSSAFGSIMLGLDSTSASVFGTTMTGFNATTAASFQSLHTNYTFAMPPLGAHFVAALEQGDNVNANVFNQNSNNLLGFSFLM